MRIMEIRLCKQACDQATKKQFSQFMAEKKKNQLPCWEVLEIVNKKLKRKVSTWSTVIKSLHSSKVMLLLQTLFHVTEYHHKYLGETGSV